MRQISAGVVIAFQLVLEANSLPRLPLEAVLRFRGQGCLLAILVLVTALYLPTLDDPFHGDDFVAFTELGTKPAGTYLQDVFFFNDSNFYWRPLGSAFHLLLFELAGLDAFTFRLAGVVVFLLTLVALYHFCLRERLGIAVALGAVAIFGLLPNHVVSVAWVTNTSRLMAVLLVLLSLIVLQSGRDDRRWWQELVALVLFIAAILSDETAMALAPVPFLYASFVAGDRMHWRSSAVRLFLYATPVLLLLPLQFQNTLNDEPRLTSYGFGPHVLTQAWALLSHLVLPLASPAPFDVFLHRIPPAQWAAGVVALAIGGVLFVFGSRSLKLLIVWTALALAPFALWGVEYTSPRYVYMAALPYSIILSWLTFALLSSLVGALARLAAPVHDANADGLTLLRGPVLRRAAWTLTVASVGAVLLAGTVTAGYASSTEVMARNESWGDEAVRYGLLRESLLQALPDVPENSRIIIYYGGWVDFWASSLVQSVYEDRSIKVINVRPDRVDSDWPPRRANDLVVYFLGDRFVHVAPRAVSP